MSTQSVARVTEESGGGANEGDRARAQLLGAMSLRERRLDLARVSTAVLEGGDGPPLLLLHGPGGCAAHFMRMIPQLLATHRLIVPDLPGHGASEVRDGVLDVDRVLAWLGALIEQTCSDKPALVGQLLGGAIAARFASEHGERIASLLLVDAFGLTPFRPAPEFAGALHAFLAKPSEQTHDALWHRCARDLDGLRAQMAEHWAPFRAYNIDRARTPSVQTALGALMEQFGGPALSTSELARIAVPTSLIWGRHDLATPLAVAQAASDRYGWPLHVIEDANDDPPIEQPAAVVRALRAALAISEPKRSSR
jgi:pimeloyl-ACP methyl ester carboxylesterase